MWLLPALQEHTTYHGQILSHVFFSDDIVRLLDEYSKSGRLTASDLELFTHDMEYNLANGEEKIQELIVVSFLESIEKQSQLYSRISPFFGEKLSYYHKLIWGWVPLEYFIVWSVLSNWPNGNSWLTRNRYVCKA